MSIDVLQRIRSADKLASPPTVALQVLTIVRNENCTVDELVRVIQSDGALTARILKLVNSPVMGVRQKIASLKQAVVVLGLRSVKSLSLSFSMVDAIREDAAHDGALDYPRYWRRSITTAVAARLVAKATDTGLSDEAFVAGLMTDLGIVAASRCAADVYEPVLKASTRRPLIEVERETFGVTHAAMGRALLEAWGLPQTLCEVVGAHHGEGIESLKGQTRSLALIVCNAARIAGVLVGDAPSSELNAVKQQCMSELRIPAETLESILKQIETNVRDAASTFSVRIDTGVDYAALAAQAAMQIAQLGVAAELERAESTRRADEATTKASTLQRENQQIRQAAQTDGLTRVANRATFDERIETEWQRARSGGYPLGLIMIDIDRFKSVNDQFGHPAGDEVLRRVAQCVREVVDRAGLVARYGGEEFAVVLPRSTPQATRAFAEDIRKSIEATPIQFSGDILRVTASMGAVAAVTTDDEFEPEQLIAAADQCLYRAKRGGRNRVEGIDSADPRKWPASAKTAAKSH